MKNSYEVRGDVTAIIINSKKYGRQETLISTSKLGIVNEFPGSWYVNINAVSKLLYVKGNMPKKDGKQKGVKLHRWVTNAPDGMYVDHINGETLDNRDDNLRLATNAENQQNRNGANENCKSGIRGVYWHKPRSKWRAQITINGIMKTLGYFTEVEDAERAVKESRNKNMPFSREAS